MTKPTLKFLALFVLVGLSSSWAVEKSAAETAIEIQKPSSTVLPEYAAYLAKWVGKWDSTWPVEFIVWRVSENGSGSIRFRWKEYAGGPWSKNDGTYKIEEGKLIFRTIIIEIDA